jgi:hypothetical protein
MSDDHKEQHQFQSYGEKRFTFNYNSGPFTWPSQNERNDNNKLEEQETTMSDDHKEQHQVQSYGDRLTNFLPQANRQI